ncbi:MAG TPA: HD domain-containing phosphohydrolase [Solirubrobacteraceae bacterium]|jgi:putative nucleotidyltransferase with HDIG domain|nr:HD domain-containing phosphohydrolase [Solirubrobacteraceae bacterium]
MRAAGYHAGALADNAQSANGWQAGRTPALTAFAGAPGDLLRLLAHRAGGGIVGHSMQVARGAGRVAHALGLSARHHELVALAGLLHDVGKSLLPRRILEKPGPLDEREWAAVRRHPAAGAGLLCGCGLAEVAAWVLAHHERPDGFGYPNGLTADQIPLEARIVAVADAYDAMIAERSYRPRLEPREAVSELRRAAGSQLDAAIVDAFLATAPRRHRAA